jgi:hypothetical protein
LLARTACALAGLDVEWAEPALLIGLGRRLDGSVFTHVSTLLIWLFFFFGFFFGGSGYFGSGILGGTFGFLGRKGGSFLSLMLLKILPLYRHVQPLSLLRIQWMSGYLPHLGRYP